MSNFIKDNPVGIDKNIQAFQTFLFGQLKTTWNLDDTSLNMYGRSYRNQTDDGYSPEVFSGGIDYKEVFFDDRVAASAFFGVKEKEIYNAGDSTADAYLIVMVNLDQIKTPNKREDENARLDVEKLCSQIRFGFRMVGFDTGIDTVFAEYSGWKKKNGMQFRDQGKKHCFRINFKLLYNIKN